MSTRLTQEELLEAFHDPHHDSRRPIFHVQSTQGWASDPSGPIKYRGKYHLFFQHVHTSCQWYWGVCWDHVVSDDLVTWHKLPPVLVPTPSWFDADGCFSGTVELDPETGLPTILYTGCYLRSNQAAVQNLGLPPAECFMHTKPALFVETQLAAVPADPDDPELLQWVKLPQPVCRHPPPHLSLTSWRDPHAIQRGDGRGKEWIFLLGSGFKGEGGAILVYRSAHLTKGWTYAGTLAAARGRFPFMGADWECPILARLPALSEAGNHAAHHANGSNGSAKLPPGWPHGPAAGRSVSSGVAAPRAPSSPVADVSAVNGTDWMLAISADAPNNPVYYWLGSYDAASASFDLDAAQGPFRLDLGRTLYAANMWQDPQGRSLLVAFIQEHRCVPPAPHDSREYVYSGCLSLPRLVWLRDDRLFQQPLPGLEKLRSSVHWQVRDVLLQPGASLLPLQHVSGTHLDLEVTFLPPPGLEGSAATSAASAASSDSRSSSTSATDELRAGASPAVTGAMGSCEVPPGVWGGAGGGPAAAAVACDGGAGCPSRVGLLVGSWRPGGRGAALITFEWSTHLLQVEFDEPLAAAWGPLLGCDNPEARRVGGRLTNMRPGDPLHLRLLLDGSALEIFTGSGEALTTRVYRGRPPTPQAVGATHLAATAGTIGGAAAAAVAPAAAEFADAGGSSSCSNVSEDGDNDSVDLAGSGDGSSKDSEAVVQPATVLDHVMNSDGLQAAAGWASKAAAALPVAPPVAPAAPGCAAAESHGTALCASVEVPGAAGVALFAEGPLPGRLARLDVWEMRSAWDGVHHSLLRTATAAATCSPAAAPGCCGLRC